MNRPRRIQWIVCLSLSLLVGWGLISVRADSDEELALQEERQKQIQAETDSLVRRLGTMIRVLDYYQVDKASERKMMEEMAGVLSGLSQNQMTEVISRLESAAKSKDAKSADQEIQEAYERHREVLDTLKALLARHDAVHNLDQAADRLDRAAKNQLELQLQTRQLIKDTKDGPDQANLLFFPQKGFFGGKKGGRGNINVEPRRQADNQVEIHQEVDTVTKQVQKLRPILPDDQKERVAKMQKLSQQFRLLDTLERIAKLLKDSNSPAFQPEAWVEVNDIQWRTAGQIKELARSLRTPSDLLAALRETRDRVDLAINRQDILNQETKENQAREEDPKQAQRDRSQRGNPGPAQSTRVASRAGTP